LCAANALDPAAQHVRRFTYDASLQVKLDLINAVQQMGAEKHLFFCVPGDSLTANFAGATAVPPTDFISVVDMNMGSQKADFGVYRSIDYHVQLLANGSGVANLTIAYDNTCFWETISCFRRSWCRPVPSL
jgi:hypothetical protein